MCLIVLAYQSHPEFPLILAGNRDEFYARPAQAAHFWPDQPSILGGRDLQAGGSWLGVHRDGRLATVTNYRNPQAPRGEGSRGELVTQLLTQPLTEFTSTLSAIARNGARYSGFSLLTGNLQQLFYYSNWQPKPTQAIPLAPGVHGLSNHLLDTPWPKLQRAKAGLQQALKDATSAEAMIEQLLTVLQNRQRAADQDLPHTGIALESERMLSSIFINGADYGTRASTLVLISKQGELYFTEQTYATTGQPDQRQDFRFTIEPPAALVENSKSV